MKNLSRIIIFCIALFAGGASAQTIKFGHIDFQQLVQLMPENDAAQKAMKKVETEMDGQLNTMQKEYTDKLKAYQDQLKTFSDAIKQAKEEELQSIAQRIQNFQQQAQQNLQAEQQKQFQPVIEKARKAIADVGKEQGMLYVFEVNSGLLYHSDQSIDILSLVKAKLGIK
jgi:outer membrane protein